MVVLKFHGSSNGSQVIPGGVSCQSCKGWLEGNASPALVRHQGTKICLARGFFLGEEGGHFDPVELREPL